jgi:hypothetical protein
MMQWIRSIEYHITSIGNPDRRGGVNTPDSRMKEIIHSRTKTECHRSSFVLVQLWHRSSPISFVLRHQVASLTNRERFHSW